MRNWAENQIMLVLIRHGETQANQERRYLGKTDESLSEKGIGILKSNKKQNLYPDVEYLFSSPMKRCMQTAAIIYPTLCPTVIPEWEEIDFGRFEYKNEEELKEDTRYQSWLYSGGTLDFPEGESRKDFILRCQNGFLRMCQACSQALARHVKKPVFVGMIVHGGTIMSLLSFYEGKDYFDYQVPTGRGYVCSLSGLFDKSVREARIQIKVAAKL